MSRTPVRLPIGQRDDLSDGCRSVACRFLPARAHCRPASGPGVGRSGHPQAADGAFALADHPFCFGILDGGRDPFERSDRIFPFVLAQVGGCLFAGEQGEQSLLPAQEFAVFPFRTLAGRAAHRAGQSQGYADRAPTAHVFREIHRGWAAVDPNDGLPRKVSVDSG